MNLFRHFRFALPGKAHLSRGMGGNDYVYYEAADQLPFAKRVVARARNQIFAFFMTSFAPTKSTTVLDIGASDHENDEANVLEKLYPYKSNITCASIGNGENIRSRYPDVKHVMIEPRRPLPFADGSFDIAYSNAVLEHVGGYEQRQKFLSEALRVASSLFIAIPNRWFPIEHHTGIPLLHYSPWLFRRSLKATRLAYWSDSANLDFLSVAKVRSEWPTRLMPQFSYAGICCGPFSSNIVIVARTRVGK
jgi:SAM-dependent methyltransferase